MPTTFFILAGEASGDTHAARLVTELKAQAPGARCVGMGGPAMISAGFEAFKDLDGMQVGFWEVAKKYGFFKKVFYDLLDKLKQTRPDALICVDYPGFNLRFAAEVKKLGIPVLYYIVPQVWAWKPGRAKKMARIVDRAFCVFEFEPPFFEKFGLKTEFVGHPLVDGAPPSEPWPAPLPNVAGDAMKTVSFLPGSRVSEINHHLAPMLLGFDLFQMSQRKARALFSIPESLHADSALKFCNPLPAGAVYGAGEKGERAIYIMGGDDDDPLEAMELAHKLNSRTDSHSRSLPAVSDFSVVKSGTSTLEAGLAGNPMCALYRGSTASYLIARLLVNIPVFSLVNIVLGRYAVPELLQSEVNPRRIAEEIMRGLNDQAYREKQRAALAEIPKKLGGPGASARAAMGILNFLSGR